MAIADEVATPAAVKSEIKKLLTHESDPWEMEHFRDRLKIYYHGQLTDADGKAVETASIAKALLDNIAVAAETQTIDACCADLKARSRFDDRDGVIELLKSLAKDHYVTRDENGRYRFRFPLVQTWWTLAQGLND